MAAKVSCEDKEAPSTREVSFESTLFLDGNKLFSQPTSNPFICLAPRPTWLGKGMACQIRSAPFIDRAVKGQRTIIALRAVLAGLAGSTADAKSK
jgi:hypothetical protein